ncbi:MAG: glycoside hydrolase family 5 protein [Bacteroidales bacterium]|nr:glycoside hydrolase family 5 protein [Bacteroidales bacterium]
MKIKTLFTFFAAATLFAAAGCDKNNPENPTPGGFVLEYTADQMDYSNESACEGNNYVEAWGRLKVVNNVLCTDQGKPVQLRGWATHGHQWEVHCFHQKDDFLEMKKNGANVVRLTMYVSDGGYVNKEWIEKCIDHTAELGMYVIVTWHFTTPGNPLDYMSKEPEKFFGDVALYVDRKGYNNVMYEICSGPKCEGTTKPEDLWKDIKDYAGVVLPEIAKGDKHAMVIVGAPSMLLEYPAKDPIVYDGMDIMYSYSVAVADPYASDDIKYLEAYIPKLPIFVTSWSTTTLEGVSFSRGKSDNFLAILNGGNDSKIKLSWCNWNWSDAMKEDACFRNYASKEYSTNGKYIVSCLRKGNTSLE